jgi:phosphate transport system protein
MPPFSTRETYDRQLNNLLNEVLVLGSMAEQAILDAVDALRRRDLQAAERIYLGDQALNAKRYAIESEALTIMATQQPMARDLRMLAAVLEIITELERIGDYAKGICRINLMLGDESLPLPVTDLQTMAELGLDMLRRALTAFIQRDADTARLIPQRDDQVDALYSQIYNQVIQQVIADPSSMGRANLMIWAAHNLERMADRVTNICERIVFVVTGEMRELDGARPDSGQFS